MNDWRWFWQPRGEWSPPWAAARVHVSAIALDALVRSGELVRVRRGAYVLRELHDAGNPEERYRLRTMAILRTRPTVDAASHHASVLMCGVDTHGVDLTVVDVIAKVKSPRVRSGLRTHPGVGLAAAPSGIHRVVRRVNSDGAELTHVRSVTAGVPASTRPSAGSVEISAR